MDPGEVDDQWPDTIEDHDVEAALGEPRGTPSAPVRPCLHGREVSPAVIEHEASAAEALRARIRAAAPSDDVTTTTDGGW